MKNIFQKSSTAFCGVKTPLDSNNENISANFHLPLTGTITMKKTFALRAIIAVMLVFGFAFRSSAGAPPTTPAQNNVSLNFDSSKWTGYMNVYSNESGSKGGHIFGSGWGLSHLKTTFGPDTLTLQPNFSAYTDSLAGNNGDRAFWTNSSDGGATAGSSGNKWMQAGSFIEVSDAGRLARSSAILEKTG